jgi:WD40 repeat protein
VYSGATGHESIVTCFASSADGDLLLSGSGDGTVKLFGLGAKKLIRTLIHCIPTAAESGDMKQAVDDDDDREQENESTFSVECVGFDGADKWIASGGMDKCLKIWERSSGACRARCEHGGGVVALQWMGAHPAVCTAALDYIVRVWDARNGSLLLSLTGHNDLITNLSVLPITAAHREQMGRADATDAIVTASDDHTSKIFYVDTLSLLASATGAA